MERDPSGGAWRPVSVFHGLAGSQPRNAVACSSAPQLAPSPETKPVPDRAAAACQQSPALCSPNSTPPWARPAGRAADADAVAGCRGAAAGAMVGLAVRMVCEPASLPGSGAGLVPHGRGFSSLTRLGGLAAAWWLRQRRLDWTNLWLVPAAR